jgi:hypothetical protein
MQQVDSKLLLGRGGGVVGTLQPAKQGVEDSFAGLQKQISF